MNSRERILSAITDLPEELSLPPLEGAQPSDLAERFSNTLRMIGGAAFEVPSSKDVAEFIHQTYGSELRIISSVEPELNQGLLKQSAHSFKDVEAFIMKAHFGVAENAAVWITDELLPHRVLPFITQHLIIVLRRIDLVATMHEAYDRIGDSNYSFGTFIAGPSKTADIEQSLVLGAHGPKSLTVFLIAE